MTLLTAAALLAVCQSAALAELFVFTYTGQLQLNFGEDDADLNGASFWYQATVDTAQPPFAVYYQSDRTSAVHRAAIEVVLFNRAAEADETFEVEGRVWLANFFPPGSAPDTMGVDGLPGVLRSNANISFGAPFLMFDQAYIPGKQLPMLGDYRLDEAISAVHSTFSVEIPSSGKVVSYLVVNPQISLVPEPTTWVLAAPGTAALVGARRKNKRRRRASPTKLQARAP